MDKLTRTMYNSPKHRTASHYVGFILQDLELFMKRVQAWFLQAPQHVWQLRPASWHRVYKLLRVH